MNNFISGLGEGLTGGFLGQMDKQHEAKMAQTKEDLDRYYKIATNDSLPDEDRNWAWGQYQTISQGKKPGAKAGGPLNPIFGKLGKLIHHARNTGAQGSGVDPQMQGQQGGWTENLPNGQAAPGTGGSSPNMPNLNPPAAGTDPETGRPSLARDNGAQRQGEEGATTDTASPPATPLRKQLENRLAAATNPFAKRRSQDALDKLTQQEEAGDAKAAYAENLATIRANTARDVADMKRQQAMELQQIKDSDALDKAKTLADLKKTHDTELEELKDKNKLAQQAAEDAARVTLKKTIPGKAPGSGKPGTDSNGRTEVQRKRLLASIETTHQNDYAALEEKIAGLRSSKTAKELAQLRKDDSAAIENKYQGAVKRAVGDTGGQQAAASGGGEQSVRVVSPDGKTGKVPASQLQDALKQGYKQVQ